MRALHIAGSVYVLAALIASDGCLAQFAAPPQPPIYYGPPRQFGGPSYGYPLNSDFWTGRAFFELLKRIAKAEDESRVRIDHSRVMGNEVAQRLSATPLASTEVDYAAVCHRTGDCHATPIVFATWELVLRCFGQGHQWIQPGVSLPTATAPASLVALRSAASSAVR